ncbi:MAG: hypothetical protein HY700_03250 [Gemmatimonadetes bacterium]|nr:hypothetical protein [Gemmatimonadota bacterium]
MKKKREAARQSRKPGRKPYQTPVLTLHGDLRSLTASKQGAANDGAGKPATRLAGAKT